MTYDTARHTLGNYHLHSRVPRLATEQVPFQHEAATRSWEPDVGADTHRRYASQVRVHAMTALKVLEAGWETLMAEVPGSFAPTVKRLPDGRILFSVSCGAKRGKDRITVQVALEAKTAHTVLDIAARHVREELATVCPHSRRFL